MSLESQFQAGLKKDLERMFPGCMVLKNDANFMQGIPDLLVLYGNKWAALECKRAFNSKRQTNQLYYVELMDSMSFAAFINPENKEEVLGELQLAFRPRRQARLSVR